MEDINNIYFNLLKENLGTRKDVISMFCKKSRPNGNAIPYSIAPQSILEEFSVYNYSDIKKLKARDNFSIKLNLIKMQAGLGSSVKRNDVIQKFAGRSELGAKGTDLFFQIDSKYRSISELQLCQAVSLEEEKKFSEICYINLVNEETRDVVSQDWEKICNQKSYHEIFSESSVLKKGEEIFQKKMPTIDEKGELSSERMAPAGHGFVGISEIVKVYNEPESDGITVIGNGEDLNSTPEIPLINWVAEKEIPIAMITTTKTKSDLKGGQISLLIEGDKKFLTIVEKAQAEESNQLEYFEQMGLREGDRKALFNTNVVVVNEAALSKKLRLLNFESLNDFLMEVAPDVISNKKQQNGKTFTQLESALGSVMLNLDRYFRNAMGEKIVSIVNIDEEDRESFFIPIKKREDYDDLLESYRVNPKSFRLERK